MALANLAGNGAAKMDWQEYHGQTFSGKSALITGGAGFIGSHLAHALHDLGAKVTVLDDLSGGGNPELLPVGTQFVRGSILDLPLLECCTNGCHWVFHQAALGSVPRSIKEPRQYFEANALGTFNVLEAARSARVTRVMFAASSSAYGDSPTLPKVESMPTMPLSPYAATKASGESLLSAYSQSYGLDTISLRYFNIFGPRQSPHNAYAAVIAAFAAALLAGKKPTIYGDGEQSRDFTYVANAVHANLLAAKSENPLRGTVMNVACGKHITINELARLMAEKLGRPELTAVHAPARTGDVMHSVADLSRAREILKYEPIINFGDGLDATLEWYRSAL